MKAFQPDHSVETKNRVLTKALLRMADHYQLSRQEVCAMMGFSEASASRLFSGARMIDSQSKEGEIALLLLRTYRNLGAILGENQAQAIEWLRSHNHYFNETPLQHMMTLTGLVETVNYLDAMRGKI